MRIHQTGRPPTVSNNYHYVNRAGFIQLYFAIGATKETTPPETSLCLLVSNPSTLNPTFRH